MLPCACFFFDIIVFVPFLDKIYLKIANKSVMIDVGMSNRVTRWKPP